MFKKYYEYLEDISEDELYEGLLGYGLFADKLPPIFSSVEFYQHVLKNNINNKKPHEYIRFSSMRDTNFPRNLGIPNPFAYNEQIKILKDNWDEIKKFFREKTEYNSHKISRIHLKKTYDKKNNLYKKSLFEMNYNNYKIDGNPDIDLLIGQRFLVKTDISNCFPSIYTHSICWAIVGKNVAKKNKNDEGLYCNKIDSTTQKITNGETHGLLIGPHSSNLLSEIILVCIDYELSKKYKYTRNIDDIHCYVNSIDEANQFVIDFNLELQKFGLSINNKKTEIIEFPISNEELWVEKINQFLSPWIKDNNEQINFNGYNHKKQLFSYKDILSYFDMVIDIMKKNNNKSSIINYAIKALICSNYIYLSENAKQLCSRLMIHYTILYPYLIRIIDEFVFNKLNTDKNLIINFTNIIFKDGIKNNNYEEINYSLLFAIKYDFKLSEDNSKKLKQIIENPDCLSKLFLWLYCKKFGDTHINEELYNKVKDIANNCFDENWLLCYELLSLEDIKKIKNINSNWVNIKRNKISFFIDEIKNIVHYDAV